VKLAVVAPAATVTDAGTVRAVLLLSETATAAPPVGAACAKVTVQVELAPGAIDAGEHVSVETPGIRLIVPPLPVTFANVPSGRTLSTLLIGTDTELPLRGFNATATTATTPLPIGVAFVPLARHVTAPLPELQVRVFPAAVSAGPAAGTIEMTSLLP